MSKLDRIEDITSEVKSRVLAAFAYASDKIGMWAFSKDGEIYYTTSPDEKLLFDFFKTSGCYEYMMEHQNQLERPLLLSDDLGMVWVAEALFNDAKNIGIIFLMGPIFLGNNNMKIIEEKLSAKYFSIEIKRQASRALSQVPVVNRNVVDTYIKMLHFVLTSKPLTEDIYYQNTNNIALDVEAQKEKEFFFDEKERRGEEIFLNAIREGNLNYKQVFDEEVSFSGSFLTETGNTIRDAKNTVLIFNALCARAAMEGGVSVSICKRMERKFANGIEACKSISILANYNEDMMYQYVKKVHDFKENPLISKATAECCEYIKANVYNEISIDTISKNLGYTPYYFTKKFYNEMGEKITDYIRRTRINYAKVELLTTNKSIEEISENLHFGTRNYFSRVFREVTGLSPVEYRKRGMV